MDRPRLDTRLRSLFARVSRRGVLTGLTSGLLAALALIAEDAAAKKKKKKRKKKKQQACQPGTPFGAVSVPGTGATVTTPLLTLGQRYRLRASGFWSSNATHGQDAFADFTFANATVAVTTYQGVRLGLAVDGGNIDLWGSYTTTHVYEREVIGQGAALSLRCSDLVHTDNSGSVLVEVFCA